MEVAVFRNRTTKTRTQGFCTLYLDEAGLAVVHAEQVTPQTLVFSHCEFFAKTQLVDLSDVLTKWVQNHRLKNLPCYWILSDNEYQLLNIEALKVPEAEMHDALAWRIKDMLEFPLNEAVFDTFAMPDSVAGSKRMQVTVAKKSHLQQVADLIMQAGLRLEVIDISELALANLANCQPNLAAHGAAMLALGRDSSDLIILRNRQLCFSRRINMALSDLSENLSASRIDALLQALTLEIRRCYDYYISQLRQVVPQQLIIAPSFELAHNITQPLQTALETEVTLLNLTESLTWHKPVASSVLQQCLFALGGALRNTQLEEELDAPAS